MKTLALIALFSALSPLAHADSEIEFARAVQIARDSQELATLVNTVKRFRNINCEEIGFHNSSYKVEGAEFTTNLACLQPVNEGEFPPNRFTVRVTGGVDASSIWIYSLQVLPNND